MTQDLDGDNIVKYWKSGVWKVTTCLQYLDNLVLNVLLSNDLTNDKSIS